ncbi:cell wall / vacuolar inhibitor of fructosidase 2-like [Phoenix dactylifera]|uniref:Cell wall / vacuolar inhibitor of fructosidase 2-like n=1 Tax=Phoenix dactylifera TaxID=42345 RepID=A0A8B7BP67_PHODC|nr:cell wall / vacuolar inhibitor of fructosidase 2-like [Phoenix dactylifera]
MAVRPGAQRTTGAATGGFERSWRGWDGHERGGSTHCKGRHKPIPRWVLPAVPSEASTACAGFFGPGAYPGYPGKLMNDSKSHASSNVYAPGFSYPLETPLEVSDLIQQACKATKYFELCVSTLSSDPDSYKADLYQLTNISLRNSLDYASASFKTVSRMFNDTGDLNLKKCLIRCAKNYESAIDVVRIALRSLASKKYDDLQTEVGTASDEAAACEEAFNNSSPPKIKSPLTERNVIMSELCQISMDIALLLGK